MCDDAGVMIAKQTEPDEIAFGGTRRRDVYQLNISHLLKNQRKCDAHQTIDVDRDTSRLVGALKQ